MGYQPVGNAFQASSNGLVEAVESFSSHLADGLAFSMQWLPSNISKQDLTDHRWSVASLLAANLIPLLGVLFLGWSTFEIVLIYWFENVVLGVVNVLKMIACSPDPDEIDLTRLMRGLDDEKAQEAVRQASQVIGSPWAMHAAKLFFVPFFTVHYGLFCVVHGVFVFVLLSGDGPMGGAPDFDPGRFTPGMLLAAGGLAASHLVSFFVNYIGRGEYRRTLLPVLMFQPYARIVVLHVAILFGAFALMALGSPVFLLLILIAGKTLMDLSLHLRQHRSKPAAEEAILTTVEREPDSME